MSLQKRSGGSTSMVTKVYDSVPTALPKQLIQELDVIAKELKKSKSELIREAVKHYIQTFNGQVQEEREDQLTRELKRLEKDLRALAVKNIRISAQTMFFASLPFQLGPPRNALTTAAYYELYKKSRAFAAEVLKAGGAAVLADGPEVSGQTQEPTAQS